MSYYLKFNTNKTCINHTNYIFNKLTKLSNIIPSINYGNVMFLKYNHIERFIFNYRFILKKFE